MQARIIEAMKIDDHLNSAEPSKAFLFLDCQYVNDNGCPLCGIDERGIYAVVQGEKRLVFRDLNNNEDSETPYYYYIVQSPEQIIISFGSVHPENVPREILEKERERLMLFRRVAKAS